MSGDQVEGDEKAIAVAAQMDDDFGGSHFAFPAFGVFAKQEAMVCEV